MKKYNVNGVIYSFDVVSKEETRNGIVYLAKCRENGKDAWLDDIGVQFCDESIRIKAKELTSFSLDDLNVLWGGELRPQYNFQKSSIRDRY